MLSKTNECMNIGNGCENTNNTYKLSPEGYCLICELKIFPDRYTGCGFCGSVVGSKHSLYCAGCKDQFCNWLIDLFYNKNKKSKSTMKSFANQSEDETNSWKLWSIIQKGSQSIVDHKISDKFPVRVFAKSKSGNHIWPGFYLNDGNNIIIDPFELKSRICIDDINWNNSKTIMLRELERNNIFPHDLVQIKK